MVLRNYFRDQVSKRQSVGPSKGSPPLSSSIVRVLTFYRRSWKSGFSMYNLPFSDMSVQKFFKQHAGQIKHMNQPTFFSALILRNTYHPLSAFPYTVRRTLTKHLLVCQALAWALVTQRWWKHSTCPQEGQPRGPQPVDNLFAISSVKFSARVKSWVQCVGMGGSGINGFLCISMGLKRRQDQKHPE